MSGLSLFEQLIVQYAEEYIERETSMNNNEPKYKIGDRVQLETSGRTYTGTVTDTNMYRIKWGDGDVTYEKEVELQYAKLSEEDAWIEVAFDLRD